jgi:nicotinamide mononucleotide adenylyltransferase
MELNMHRYDVGVIHGRFQVLHNDHVKYLLSGKALCRHLLVGITNPEPLLTKAEAVDPNRSHVLANPLTYFERYVMVKKVLAAQGLDQQSFSIVPLPINFPDRYRHYVPLDAVFFLTIYDHWGERKLHYFTSLGLKTHILRHVSHEEKGISASDVRKRMIEDTPWEHLVPPPAAKWLKGLGLPSRIKGLGKK